ncbi:MAG TPA: lamin tail domain-containing protein, partial [Clostridia bacterium]|nr:lamin tail domain-containing protein [Clostridia bacterium]
MQNLSVELNASVLFGKRPRIFACLLAVCWWIVPQPLCARVLINEIHYDPDVKTEPAEFIELYNSGSTSVSLSGWGITGGITYTIPNGTTLDAGGYLVIAQNPATIAKKFGVNALGPWVGRLNNDGDLIQVVNAAGVVEDKVDYQLGFPWPTVGDPPGYSIELINPAFDNGLGGNWRASVVSTNTGSSSYTLIPEQSTWRFFKGLTEASFPTYAWRALGFDDSGWSEGLTPIGYDPFLSMGTYLDDMSSRYCTVFFRKTFVVNNVSEINTLLLRALYDDGFKLWINEHPVRDGDFNMAAGELAADQTAGPARESTSFDLFYLNSPQNFLVAGTNIIAIQAANALLGGSSDFFLDLELEAEIGANNVGRGPTPGAKNSVFAANAPPQIRQVDHSPKEPKSGQSVTITAKVTDPEGVQSVSLMYQVVEPGNYIELTDAAYTAQWTAVTMNDAGVDGDIHPGDSTYTATLPASLQQHRRLIRYRIQAVDGTGASVAVPYVDDPQPNFAYFCYDGVPAWSAATRPGVTPVLSFSTNAMRHLPAVHLISKKYLVEDATWFSRYPGDAYLWAGTLVYDGKVYDHIHYRARGGVWRYAMVKNMWKFDFNRGHDFEMRDDYGRKYNAKWTKLNLGASIQQGDYGHRGEQGMFESVGLRMFNLVGVESSKTTFLQFRVIDEPLEADPTTQYEGDFWGVYLAVEQEDSRFLDEHNMPDGNLYKMDSQVTPFPYGELNNQGATAVTDKSDLSAFVSGLRSSSPVEWWRTNWYLPNGYSYQAIVQGIHHYDIGAGKNYFYYLNPETKLWTVHAWDLDLTWADNMYDAGGQGGEPFKSYAITKTPLLQEYRNRVREIRDLLFNTDQAWQLIDEYAWLLRGPTNEPTILDADRCQWDYNPKMNTYSSAPFKAGQGRFYQWPNEPSVSKDFNGCIQLMKNYIVSRSTHLDSLAADSFIPSQPSVTYLGPTNYPLNQLSFRASTFSGQFPFAAMKWRIGEVSDPMAPGFDPNEPRPYEITPVWESEEQTTFNSDITIPSSVVKVGHIYRVRVRVKDTYGGWSRWSEPVQFEAGLPDNASSLAANLRITELMYQPAGGSDYEFVELYNTSTNLSLDLQGAKFTAGIDYTFTGTTIPPQGYLLVTRTADRSAFRAYYGLPESTPIVGPYSGSLANEGEQLTLKTGAGGLEIVAFQFGSGRGWPLAAQGAGHSLVPLDFAIEGQATGALDYPGNWRASSYVKGSPGRADPDPLPVSIVLNEIVAHTDYSNPARPEYDSDDWIELYNTSAAGITLNGWFLSDDPGVPRKWAIPAVNIPARSWITFDEVSGFHNPITTGFGLDKAGEQVLLSYMPGNAQDRVVDAIEFKGQENEVSLGRYPDGSAWWFPMLRTSNTVNSAGLTGVRISEVMYHPPDLATNDNTRDEYVELFNPTSSPITLQDTNGVWRLSGGIGFTFPQNTTIASGKAILVVNFNPADATTLAAFRSAYGLTDSSLPILGPYTGKLGNRSDRVALEKPQFPDLVGDPYSWVIVD